MIVLVPWLIPGAGDPVGPSLHGPGLPEGGGSAAGHTAYLQGCESCPSSAVLQRAPRPPSCASHPRQQSPGSFPRPGDGEAVEGHKVPSVAAPAFVRVLLQEGSTLALRAGPLSLGPQLVGCLLQQWGTEGQNASLLLRGLLACRPPLHPCKAMDGGLSQSGRDIPNSRWEFPSAQSWWGKASFSYSAPGSTLLPPLTAPCLLRGGRPLSSILDVSGHPCVLQPLKDVVAHQPVQPIIHVLPGTSGKDVSQQLGGKHWPYDGCKLQNHLLLQRDPVQLSQCNLCQEEAKRLSLLCPGA